MKASRVYLTMVASSVGAMALVILVCLAGYFRAVEKADSGSMTEARLLAELEGFHSQLKSTEDPEGAKRLMKTLESRLGADSEAIERARKAYNPVLAQFAGKPKEAEARYLLVKKRELMESLVNAYRKDIAAKNITLCLAYLSVLYDMQNSLLYETEEAEAVFLKRNRERFGNLKQLAAAANEGAVVARVAAMESVFAALERGFELSSRWRDQRSDALAKIEKSLPRIVKEVRASGEAVEAGMRRSFLYSAVLAALVCLAALIALYLGHKLMKVRFEARLEALARYLREFGREKTDPSVEKSAEVLADDPDWMPVLRSAKEAETEFARTYQTLLSVPKSMRLPFLVFTRDRVLIHASEAATKVFELPEGGQSALDEVIRRERVGCRDGDPGTLIETVLNSFSTPQEDSHEILLRQGEEWVPTELISYPISYGPIAGGRIYLFREVRGETERVDRAVTHQLTRLRDFVHKITHFYPVEVTTGDDDSVPLREALDDLGTMKMKIDERETLWKSEAEALIDQIGRQKEVLERLAGEIGRVRETNGELINLVAGVYEVDENWHDEVNVMERDLTRWEDNRKRILSELAHYSSVMGRIRGYESGLRQAVEEVGAALRQIETGQAELAKQCGEAKLHAANLSLGADSEHREYAARARAYAAALAKYSDEAGRLLQAVREFLSKHPGGSLYPLLESVDLDPALLENLREEQERIHGFLQRWKSDGAKSVAGGDRALGLLRDMDKKGQLASQLGETSLLINDQAKGNIERWN